MILTIISIVIGIINMIINWFSNNSPGPRVKEAMAKLRNRLDKVTAICEQHAIVAAPDDPPTATADLLLMFLPGVIEEEFNQTF